MTTSFDSLNKLADLVAERLSERYSDEEENENDDCDCDCDCDCQTHDKDDDEEEIIAPIIAPPGTNVELAKKIDHTLLKPEATREELLKVCEEAKKYGFATVCVNSSNIALVASELRGTPVKPIAVVGFPLGAMSAQGKAYEAQIAVEDGAREIDTVINIGALKAKDYQTVLEDIALVVEASHPYKVKVILETSNLTNEEKIAGCILSKAAGAHFVKTSTGFGKSGATVEDITLMRQVVGPDMLIKASGGIRTTEDALKMIKAGADRIGASASIAIVTGKPETKGGY